MIVALTDSKGGNGSGGETMMYMISPHPHRFFPQKGFSKVAA